MIEEFKSIFHKASLNSYQGTKNLINLKKRWSSSKSIHRKKIIWLGVEEEFKTVQNTTSSHQSPIINLKDLNISKEINPRIYKIFIGNKESARKSISQRNKKDRIILSKEKRIRKKSKRKIKDQDQALNKEIESGHLRLKVKTPIKNRNLRKRKNLIKLKRTERNRKNRKSRKKPKNKSQNIDPILIEP
jgi:hypothetical protein